MTTLQAVELGVLGPLQVRRDGAPVAIPGAKPRAILTMLGLHSGAVVSADTLLELLWGDDSPRTAAKALQTHISSLRRTLGDGFVLTEGAGWTLADTKVDASRYKAAARLGRDAAAAGDASQAVARFEEALALWRGIPELPDGQRGSSEKTRWVEIHAALVEDRADALLATGRAAEIIGELEAAVADAPLRERRWGQLMVALYRAGRQGEALGAYQRARSLLADQLGVDPGPDLRRLEAAIVAQDATLDMPVAQHVSTVTRAVTFLLTDIEGSTEAWEADAEAMAAALARHDELVEQVVTSGGGRLIKTRGEGDATFSVFERPSAAAAAAIELQEAIAHEPWALREPIKVRVALHTGEVELRDGDYFGRAVNRAARLRSLASGGQILCSGATAELVIDSLADDVVLADLGTRQLRNLARPEHVFELRLETDEDRPEDAATDEPIERPELPAALTGPGPFVGRGRELEQLSSAWQTALSGGMRALLIAGEPGVGKTRLAGEWSRLAYEQGAVVLYGRCDEDLGAPYQPFAEALRTLVPCLGATRLRGLRGAEALLSLVPGLADVLPDLTAPTHADPDTERYALFDAVVALLEVASAGAPVVLVLDDLHWAAKPTLLLLRHLLRFGEQTRVQIVGTYRSTDLDRSHPLAAMLADLHRDGTAERLQLSGLDEHDVTMYVAEAGYDDEELARALASVTGGNPFFLIEALRHVDESGGAWDQSTLPQGVREAVSRRLSRLPVETNKALAAAAVVGSRFAVELVERVVDQDLVDAFDEACKAGIVIEEPGGYYRFNHALVRQSLLAELPSVRRMRLHQRIATTLEAMPGDDELLAELAYHYFECAWAGNAAKAVEYCRRAADQAMARLAYEGAADLYDRALHALEELDEELSDREDQTIDLLVARCEALLAAGDVASAAGVVAQLQQATRGSARLAAWATCFDGQLSMLIHPERLDEIEAAVGAAADKLAELDDAAGEAKAHTVRAVCLARLGRIGDCEVALDHALTAARRARESRRVNAVLAAAPLAALWGPNPVPRAGGRCLDVVRLLRITTESPAVEATSTRCQAVLEAFRGRAAAGRRMIDSARRTIAELGLRHALLEVEQFAGIVELIADDLAAAEPHLRVAYKGFRRMGLDADTAETAALLGRTCLALDRYAEADELCAESERLAGHALKASIAWRTLRAQLLSRGGEHDEARRLAEAAVTMAENTDILVDHGDACLTLAMVLRAAGDTASARAAAEQAVGLYDRKGAVALAEMARGILGEREAPTPPAPPDAPEVQLDNACVRTLRRGERAIERKAWDEFEQLFATDLIIQSRRKMVGFTWDDLPPTDWPRKTRSLVENDGMRVRIMVVAVRGERLALTRLELGTADVSAGAPKDELLQLFGLDGNGRIALQISFDIDDMDGAMAELEAAHLRFEALQDRGPGVELDNECLRAIRKLEAAFNRKAWGEVDNMYAPNVFIESQRKLMGFNRADIHPGNWPSLARRMREFGGMRHRTTALAVRGDCVALTRVEISTADDVSPGAPHDAVLQVCAIDADGRLALQVWFEMDDMDAAVAELEAAYARFELEPGRGFSAELDNACVRAIGRIDSAVEREDWTEVERQFAPTVFVESRRKIVGFAQVAVSPGEWATQARRHRERGWVRQGHVVVAVRGDRLAVTRFDVGTADTTHGAPEEEMIQLCGLDKEGRIASQTWFDTEDIDAAMAELDVVHARFEAEQPRARQLENAASRACERFRAHLAAGDWAAMAETLAEESFTDDRRRLVGAGITSGRDVLIANMRAGWDIGYGVMTSKVLATRGEQLILSRVSLSGDDKRPEPFHTEMLRVLAIDADQRITIRVLFDNDDIDAAFEELDRRYLAGEAAAHAEEWSATMSGVTAVNRHEMPRTTADYVIIDHRLHHTTSGARGLSDYLDASWDLAPSFRTYIEAVHRLSDIAVVITLVVHGTTDEGNDIDWRIVEVLTHEGGVGKRCEIFDESDLEKALARFEELQPQERELENTASGLLERYLGHFATRDWDAMTEALADDFTGDDRRRVVNGGVRRGRDVEIANVQVIAEVGCTNISSTPIATRGERLVLARHSFTHRDWPHPGVIDVVEINGDNLITAQVMFDLEEIDKAFEELDAWYLAGEAADHAHTWSTISRAFAALNRREIPETTDGFVDVDHRRISTVRTGDMIETVRSTLDLANRSIRVESVHRLTDLGAVVTYTANATSEDGFDAEWRIISVYVVEGDRISRAEIFDEDALDAALARFEELSSPSRQPENAASQAYERFWAAYEDRDWKAVAAMLADGHTTDDRRRVIGSGARHGREAMIKDLQVTATQFGPMGTTTAVIAKRGVYLALIHARYSDPDQRPESFHTDALTIVEIDSEKRIAAFVLIDPDDIETAFEELEARYLAGEAAPHAQTWSVITRGQAAVNRGEPPPITPDCVNIDHRRGAPFAQGEMVAYLQAGSNLNHNIRSHVEVVHRLTDLGAVCTHVGQGVSADGFDAEWRGVDLVTVEGDMVNRCEVFEEADLDAALARFDELFSPTPRLGNAATRAEAQLLRCIAARDWEAITAILADEYCGQDRRHLVNVSAQLDREVAIAHLRSMVDLGVGITSELIAIRGERLAFSRVRWLRSEQGSDEFHTEVLNIVEINEDGQIIGRVMWDPEDTDIAFEELDARYLAGEAAAHAHTWTVIADTCAAVSRREVIATTPDWVNIDHRRATAFVPGEATALLRATWDLVPDFDVHIESVHRLTDLGAVCTYAAHGASQQGFNAEWRGVNLLTVEGDLLNRCEIFDEADLDTALARFDELHVHGLRLENAASRTFARLARHFAANDWAAITEEIADTAVSDDRRAVVNAGARHGRDAVIADISALRDIGVTDVRSEPIATRGDRLILLRGRYAGSGRPDAYHVDALNIVEIDANERVAAQVTFDPDDIDAAYTELDARYLAGEAAAFAQTWSAIAKTNAAFRQGESARTTEDVMYVDHRLMRAPLDAKSQIANVRAAWDLTPELSVRIAAVHRLSRLGAVITHIAEGTSQDGFDAEWHDIILLTFDGELIDRCELFDEADLDAALARFAELHPQKPRLENAASRADGRLIRCYADRDWAGVVEILADAYEGGDRRRVVNIGRRAGREAALAQMQTMADLGVSFVKSNVIAVRGDRLVLSRGGWSGPDQRSDAFHTAALAIVEIDNEERIVARVMFDPDDIDAAFDELETRYLAGEAARYSAMWSVISQGYAALNRHELAPSMSDWVIIDHQVRETFSGGDLNAYASSSWDLMPDVRNRIEKVHRLSNLGAVVTHMANGTTQDGFEAEWRMIVLLTVRDDVLNRGELFNENDLDTALARFDELQTQRPWLENAVSRIVERFAKSFAAHDWDTAVEALSVDYYTDDRRRVINAGVRKGRDAAIEDLQVGAEVGLATDIAIDVIATRGDRLILSRYVSSDSDGSAVQVDLLQVIECTADDHVRAAVLFDPDDIDAAFAELDARYLAGEAAEHAHTWSTVATASAMLQRGELGFATQDSVYIDHRLGRATLDPPSREAYFRAARDSTPNFKVHIEAVHRLSSFGAVITQVVHGTSPEGVDAEWRMIEVRTVEGDLINRCELFDEENFDAALARFDELQVPKPRLENAATRAWANMVDAYNRRDRDGFFAGMTEYGRIEDRRKGMRAIFEGPERRKSVHQLFKAPDSWRITSEPIAIRGSRLSLLRHCLRDTSEVGHPIRVEQATVMEVSDGDLLCDTVTFDPEDIDAAVAELESRYMAGEAAAHANTWSVIAGIYAKFNRRELPATTPDLVTVDHRPVVKIDVDDIPANVDAVMLQLPNLTTSIEAVHRLSDLGAVVSHLARGTSVEGFDAEWRMIFIYIVDGDLLSRYEFFDEADLDAALARFDELQVPKPRLENAASQLDQRFWGYFEARDWDAIAAITDDNVCIDDRRRVVNAGVERGLEAHLADLRAIAEVVGAQNTTSTAIATRGTRLALTRAWSSHSGLEDYEVSADVLSLVEISADNRTTARIGFDLDDIDAAFAELESRYTAGEAAAHANTWAIITRAQAALFHRRELPPTTPNWVNLDHRRGIGFAPGDMSAYIRALWDNEQDMTIYIEAVHRLSDVGAVFVQVLTASSADGFDAEWRLVELMTVDGDLISRCEVFDEVDIDAALAQFDELSQPGQ